MDNSADNNLQIAYKSKADSFYTHICVDICEG